ncbi:MULTISPECIES: ubiquinol-cytochrome c reductase iron-sulfur subunit [Subtercola]|uniref:Cytochrome bc1 complex Rieske iron-sulfur subunit n=1 Tax=Subtercola vilae TaxID=2056433 RepID=A0A4T2C7E7_9MICO|nr:MULTISPECIES: Rieske (2Fe-2S) protein [Subtercola]MEA9986823.1 Rieske (2Fe-2S) protein [Subtercola sp. RTI3]TIH40365.1 Rieske (2Fe-2S) protein [Subtercola vilae]
MTEKSPVTRRVVLTAGSAGVLGASALVLAACAPTDNTNTGGAAAGSTAAPTGAPSTAAAEAPATSSGSAAGGTEVAKLADVPVGQAKTVTFKGKSILVAQPTAGEVVAFSSVCPHQGCAVAFAQTDFACPCHGSTFDLSSGSVTHGPAQTGLSKIAVAVSGDSIVAS